MAGSGSEACSDSPASSREERKMAKRQVGGGATFSRNDFPILDPFLLR